jgi:choline dehydrogenase-like flavoprotein
MSRAGERLSTRVEFASTPAVTTDGVSPKRRTTTPCTGSREDLGRDRKQALAYVATPMAESHRGSMHYDAIVIGTGFGGAATACRLSQAGLNILVLERGRRFTASDFPDLPADDAWLPDFEGWSWEARRGLWDIRDLGSIVSAQAAGYGGGSLIYASVQLQPPASVFEDWPEGYDSKALRPFYDLAGWMLDIAPVDESNTLSRLEKTRRFDEAAAALHRNEGVFHPPLAIRYADGPNAFGRELKACNGCGRCCVGCPHQAKNSLDHNYLALVESYPNARVKTRCEVLFVHSIDGGYGVEYRDELSGGVVSEVTAQFVFVCAGTVGTVSLLASSRARAASEPGRGLSQLSPRLGQGYFANGDSVSLVFDAQEAHVPTHGPTITTSLAHDDGEGFLLMQDGGYPVELAGLADAFAAPAWLARNRFRPSARADDGRTVAIGAPRARCSSSSSDSGHPSLLDRIARAAKGGEFDAAIPDQLRHAAALLRDEVMQGTRPEFETLIDGLLDQSIESFLRKVVGPRLAREGELFQWLLHRARGLTLRFLTDREKLVVHAQRSLFERVGLFEPKQGLTRELARWFGEERRHIGRGAVLLAMGRDVAADELIYDAQRRALWCRAGARKGAAAARGERLARDLAHVQGGELRTNPLCALLGKPMTVHSQGGCSMAVSPEEGVTTLEGEVHGHPGLFVVDASVFPSSVGVNPSATVLAIAERNVLAFLRRLKADPSWPLGDPSAGARQLRDHQRHAEAWACSKAREYVRQPPKARSPKPGSPAIGLRYAEKFNGILSPARTAPAHEADYHACESAGARQLPSALELSVEIADLTQFWRDPERRADVHGTALLGSSELSSSCSLTGSVRILLPAALLPELRGGPDDRFFVYDLELATERGERQRLHMYKRFTGVFNRLTWRSSSRAFTTLSSAESGLVVAAGVLRIDMARFAFESLSGLEVTGTSDPAQIVWALASFGQYFMGGLAHRSALDVSRWLGQRGVAQL